MNFFKPERMRKAALAVVLTAALGGLVLSAGACSSDDNKTPSGNAGSAGESGSAGQDNGGAGNSAGSDNGGSSNGGETSCVDSSDMDCYSCTPETLDQFYNQCPTDGCEPFDNSTLSKLDEVPEPPSS